MKLKLTLVAAAALALLLAFFFNSPSLFGVCYEVTSPVRTYCSAPLAYPYGMTLFPVAAAFLGAAVVALAITRKSFKRWLAFSAIYGAIVGLILIAVGDVGFGLGGFGLSLFEREELAIIFAVLYGIICLPLFAISELLERRKR